jgi:hypothetical protein
VDGFTNVNLRNESGLRGLLAKVTGLNANDVYSEKRLWTHASVGVMVNEKARERSTQRLSLQSLDRGLALYTWPAELVPQAKAMYQTGRAQRLLDFLAGEPGPWRVRPNVHLAYRNAPVEQRLYLHCHLGMDTYIRNWVGDDFARVRSCPGDQVREDLWPWLMEHRYATSEDEARLGEFLRRLGRRDAHLRPGIQLKRVWPWPDAGELQRSGSLTSKVRDAIIEIFTVLDEPLPPACTDMTADGNDSR